MLGNLYLGLLQSFERSTQLIVLDLRLLLTDDVWIDGARLQVFDMNGVFQRGISKMELPALAAGDLYKPQRVTVDGQSRLYVTDTRRNVVQVYDSIDFSYLGTIYDLDDPMRIPVGITLGGNDLKNGISKDTAFSNLKKIVDAIQDSGAKVIIGGIDIPFRDRGFGKGYQELAEQTGAVLIPNIFAGIMGKNNLMSDPIHPNDAGYQMMAQKFYQALQP